MAYKIKRYACISCRIMLPIQGNYFSPHLALWCMGNDVGGLLPTWAGRYSCSFSLLLQMGSSGVHVCLCTPPFKQLPFFACH